MKFLYGLTIAGTIVGGLILLVGLTLSNGAPQEAAVAAVAVAFAVLPYRLARAAHGISSINARSAFLDEQHAQTKLLAAIANNLGSAKGGIERNEANESDAAMSP